MRIFALVDANSFYASCEIAFNPALENRPVVVLSNNDGCIVAANQIAKNLAKQTPQNYGAGGYHAAKPTSMMFQPYFKVKNWLKNQQAAVFSSNYELYGDMSNRLHSMLGEFAPRQEVYSIDESFLDFSGMEEWNLTEYASKIQAKIKQGLGLPVAVGIAPTKTLAKLANHLAKAEPSYQGVLDLTQIAENDLNLLLQNLDVSEVWGIGKRLTESLKSLQINSVFALKTANLPMIKAKFGVVLERIVRELNGISCLELEEVRPAKKQIISSKSFGQPVTDLQYLKQAVANYTARAAEKLRAQGSTCQYLEVFISTDRFKPNPYAKTYRIGLVEPTDNTILLIKSAKQALKKLFQPGLVYQKVGIGLSDIQPKTQQQFDIFSEPKLAGKKADKLMKTLDLINQKMGAGSLQIGAEGIGEQPNNWQMRRNHCSPRYTTRLEDVLVVN